MQTKKPSSDSATPANTVSGNETSSIIFRNDRSGEYVAQLRLQLQKLASAALVNEHSRAGELFDAYVSLEQFLNSFARSSNNAHVSRHRSFESGPEGDEKPYKRPEFEDLAELRPEEALQEVFDLRNHEELMEDIGEWKRRILTTGVYFFDDESHRAELWTFFDQLLYLVDYASLFVIHRRQTEQGEMGRFFDRYTLSFAKRELWDCFEALVHDSDENTDKSVVITTYRCLLTTVTAAYFLLGQEPLADATSAQGSMHE